MKLAVMQPYFFPYIGYFQLVDAVDSFIFYDDVNYIKGGWINRNRILINGQVSYLTISCIKPSPNKLINEIEFDSTPSNYKKILKTLAQSYAKAPYFTPVFNLIQSVLSTPTRKISVLAMESVKQVSGYLDLDTKFFVSSKKFPETKGNERTERLVGLCKKINATNYINSIGGQELYSKISFENEGIQLNFLETDLLEYKQFKNDFVPGLSIIDIMMFNSVEDIKRLLKSYSLQ